jgi:hypothetical protein
MRIKHLTASIPSGVRLCHFSFSTLQSGSLGAHGASLGSSRSCCSHHPGAHLTRAAQTAGRCAADSSWWRELTYWWRTAGWPGLAGPLPPWTSCSCATSLAACTIQQLMACCHSAGHCRTAGDIQAKTAQPGSRLRKPAPPAAFALAGHARNLIDVGAMHRLRLRSSRFGTPLQPSHAAHAGGHTEQLRQKRHSVPTLKRFCTLGNAQLGQVLTPNRKTWW